jgi:hypothetical protein
MSMTSRTLETKYKEELSCVVEKVKARTLRLKALTNTSQSDTSDASNPTANTRWNEFPQRCGF